MELLRKYVDLFNERDEETHKNLIDNAHANEWLKKEPNACLHSTLIYKNLFPISLIKVQYCA